MEGPEGLRRVLGPLDATCIVIGAIVGVGIFFTPSQVAATTGSGGLALLTWGIAGLIALCGALTLAELGGLQERSGGQYRVLRESFGPGPAFLYVFCNATAVQTGAIAIIALICVENLLVLCDTTLSPGARAGLATLLILGLTGANILGVKVGSRIQNLTVYAKVITLIGIAALALLGGEPGRSITFATEGARETGPVWLVCSGLVACLFTFGGWQHALWIGGEIREPRRNVPRAMVVGVLVVILIYLLANWAYLHLLGHAGVAGSSALAADAVSRVWPEIGGRVVAAAVAFSAFGVLNAQFLSGPRLVYALARDRLFFTAMGRPHPRRATPWLAIAMMAVISLGMLWVAGADGVEKLVTGVVFVDTCFFLLTGLALFVLRRRRPEAHRPVKVPLYPLVPALFVIGELGILVGAHVEAENRQAALIGAAWLVLGLVLYGTLFRKRITPPKASDSLH